MNSRRFGRVLTDFAQALVEANVHDWDYDTRFLPPKTPELHPVIREAAALADTCGIESHPFFLFAGASPAALRMWVGQEVFVSGIFAQLLSLTASCLANVHQRAMLNLVVYGEHGNVRNGFAACSHPWLLHELTQSIGISSSELLIAPATRRFLSSLGKTMTSPMAALGCLGVGNERLLVPEYTAVRAAFSRAMPDAPYERFLRANIDEDTEHAALIACIASGLAVSNPDLAGEYFHGAEIAVEARLEYYDNLLADAKR